MNIFVDESGYTGEDLWNPEQRVFVVASTNLTDTEALRLRSECFAGIAAAELKHSRLVRSPRGRTAILRFVCQAQESLRDRFTVYLVHKRYALTTFWVDLWVEPSMYKMGYDLYERGGNIAMSNATFLGLQSLLRESFDEHLRRFQAMMVDRTRDSFDAFWSELQRTHDASADLVKELLQPFLLAADHLGFGELTNMAPRSLNLAFSCALKTITSWRSRSPAALEVFHDRSSNMAREQWAWDALVDPAVGPVRLGGDRRTIEFPLNVSRTKFIGSASSIQVQLADVLAGAAAALGSARMVGAADSEYADRLDEAGLRNLVTDGIWPTKDVTPAELGTETGRMGQQDEVLKFVGKLLDRAQQRPRR